MVPILLHFVTFTKLSSIHKDIFGAVSHPLHRFCPYIHCRRSHSECGPSSATLPACYMTRIVFIIYRVKYSSFRAVKLLIIIVFTRYELGPRH